MSEMTDKELRELLINILVEKYRRKLGKMTEKELSEESS
jgi:hypothetical protein